LEGNNFVNIAYNVVKYTLSNFNKILEITGPEDKKDLIQLIIRKITIKDKKYIEAIEIHFDKKVQKYFINN
jgi:site-specific DNA recombinase